MSGVIIKMDDDDRLMIGASLRGIYEIFKTSFKTEQNEDIFDFVESLGKDARKILEEDPKFKKVYQGAAPVRIGKEFIASVKKIIDE